MSTYSATTPRATTPTTPLSMATSSPTSPPRTSRFTEGSPLTGDEVFAQTSASNALLFTILSQMDDHERRRQRSHRGSNSSTESFMSTMSVFGSFSPSRDRRSVTFNSRGSVELVHHTLDKVINGDSEKGKGIKGRLRAWTGGRERSGSIKPYTGP